MSSNDCNTDDSATKICGILPNFTTYSLKLDHSYDKYESIYKLNRDLTRESKKLICTLHRLPGCPEVEQESCLEECSAQLSKLQDGIITTIFSMLDGEPSYFYSPAHAGGIEEYIEALLFFSFLKGNFILSYEQVCSFMDGQAELMGFFDTGTTTVPNPECSRPAAGDVPTISDAMLPYDSYILGLSDVSGELMRYFVKCAGIGEVAKSASVLCCLRQMSSGYGALQAVAPSLENKIGVHRRNLAKVEEINYNLNLRRSELPSDSSNTFLLPLEDDFVI